MLKENLQHMHSRTHTHTTGTRQTAGGIRVIVEHVTGCEAESYK